MPETTIVSNPEPERLDDTIALNFHYAMAERGVRSHYDPNAFAPAQFPYPRGV
jgi:hypothetical protein